MGFCTTKLQTWCNETAIDALEPVLGKKRQKLSFIMVYKGDIYTQKYESCCFQIQCNYFMKLVPHVSEFCDVVVASLRRVQRKRH